MRKQHLKKARQLKALLWTNCHKPCDYHSPSHNFRFNKTTLKCAFKKVANDSVEQTHNQFIAYTMRYYNLLGSS